MNRFPNRFSIRRAIALSVLGFFLVSGSQGFSAMTVSTNKFEGVKANTGTATLSKEGKTNKLTWSEDFKIPDTPAPHWQVVDSQGNTHLLNRLVIKGDKQNKSIAVPSYIKDIVKVQIWCSYAEALLGEASFSQPMAMGNDDFFHPG
ncbi:MAG TPA: hypothetical protein PKK23_14330 [Nitrospirales bacterium]|nr:hypothetical protein [Nitrospirales bacterium]